MWLNQTIFPSYRTKLVRILQRKPGLELSLSAGAIGFSSSLRTDEELLTEIELLTNRYWFRKGLLWQSGVLQRSLRDDVLITEFNLRALSTMVLVARRSQLGLPVVFWGHIYGKRKDIIAKVVRRWMLQRCSGFVCYTETQAALLRNEFPWLRIWVSPNSICCEADCESSGGFAVQKHDLIYVGRLVREKKVDLLIEGFELALKGGALPSDALCIIVGDGPELFALRSLASNLGVGGKVVFKGEVTDLALLKKLYASALCAVSPGYIGLSAIQAFAFGVPMVIASDEPHSPEIEACRTGFNCRYFRGDNAEDLARNLGEMYENRRVWAERQQLISADIRNKYTMERMASTFIEVDQSFYRGDSRSKRRKRILDVVVYWDYLQSYHCARIKALLEKQVDFGISVLPLALSRRGRGFHQSEISSDLLERIRVVPEVGGGFSLAGALSALNPHVVCTPGYVGRENLSALFWARRNNRGATLMFETLEHDRRRRWWVEVLKRRLIRWYDSSITGGSLGRDYLIKLGMPADHISLGYDVVDNGFYRGTAAEVRLNGLQWRKQLDLPEKYFLAVGRLIPKKNFMGLVRSYALHHRKRSGKSWPLIIVGDGPELDPLHRLVTELGLSGVVLHRGYLNSADVARYMALAKVFVMPSLFEEQWGLVINEAMASGIPVLASRICGATSELVVEGKTGFTFDAQNHDELAALFTWSEDNQDKLEAMGVNAQSYVEKCSLSVFANSLLGSAEKAWCRASRRSSWHFI